MLLLLVQLALAGVSEDLIIAADKDLPTELRREAMNRLQTEASFKDVIKLAKSAETPAARRWVAVRSLGKNPAAGTREALLELLSASEAPVRMAACASLAERQDGTVTGRVAARLTDPALLVRASAADALALMRDPSTLGDLGRALADPSNYNQGSSVWVRRHYVEAIAAIGTNDALPYLSHALDDADPAVAKSALAGLRKVAGVDFSQGRTPDEELAAWRRWVGAKTRQ